jgi:hypothetical protein
MTQEVRIDRDGVREVARALRAAHARWMETLAQAQRARQALAAAVQAAPGRAFEAAAAQTAHRLQQGGERLLRLAETLEKALQRLEEAFAEAARAVEEGWIAPPLPTTPLAVDGSGAPLPNQFVLRFRVEGVDLPWNAACGPMALSMALSRLTGRPLPAQAVADRLIQETKMKPQKPPGEERAINYTRAEDLQKTARAYGVEGRKVDLDGSSSEAAWEALQAQIIRPRTAVIALVTAKSQTTNWTDSWQGADGRPAEAIVPHGKEANRRRRDPHGSCAPPGGRDRPLGSGRSTGGARWGALCSRQQSLLQPPGALPMGALLVVREPSGPRRKPLVGSGPGSPSRNPKRIRSYPSASYPPIGGTRCAAGFQGS